MNNILLEEKLYKKIQKYFNSWPFIQTSIGSKWLRFRFDKIDGFIRVCGGEVMHLVLFYGWFDKICDTIKYLIS